MAKVSRPVFVCGSSDMPPDTAVYACDVVDPYIDQCEATIRELVEALASGRRFVEKYESLYYAHMRDVHPKEPRPLTGDAWTWAQTADALIKEHGVKR
jgi:hypothetical protein